MDLIDYATTRLFDDELRPELEQAQINTRRHQTTVDALIVGIERADHGISPLPADLLRRRLVAERTLLKAAERHQSSLQLRLNQIIAHEPADEPTIPSLPAVATRRSKAA